MKIKLPDGDMDSLEEALKSWGASEQARSIFYCPNCRAKCQFRIVWHSGMQARLDQINADIKHYVLQCTACRDFLFIQTAKLFPDLPLPIPRIVHQFPPSGIKPHPSIPPGVAIDFIEASICLSAGAWNAVTVMCRRALQSCAKERKADSKEDLFDQLKELKDKGIISGVLYDAAEAIRKKGNVGAHPGKDSIVNQSISEKEARSVFGLIEQVFRYVYEFPSEVQEITGP